MRQVSKKQFDDYIKRYPRELDRGEIIMENEEFVSFDLDRWMAGEVAYTSIERDPFIFKGMDGTHYLYHNLKGDFHGWFTTPYHHWSMKPQEDNDWGPWTKHDGGECPIPEVKAGNYEIKFGDGHIYNRTNENHAITWCKSFWDHSYLSSDFHIVAYRIKKHLLKPVAPINDDCAIRITASQIQKLQKLDDSPKPYTPKDQYILNYVHEEPKGVVHEDEGMSRLIANLMRK